MTQKEARKIMLWKAIERYRTAGGREEHHAYKEALDNYIDGMLDVSEMDEVAHRFAHPLALELECVLADRNANWDRAMNLIGEYRSAMNAIHEQHSPTHMGEPLRHNSIADVHEAARLLEAARALPVDGLDAEPVQPNRDWDHIDDVLPVIELMRSGKWVWGENMRCKYVEVRIDTRDGGCIIKDRHDVRITPAELVKQFYGRGGLSWTEYDEIFSPPIAKQQEPS